MFTILLFFLAAAATRENLVFIIADDLNIWTSPYTTGPCVNTPFLNDVNNNFTIFKNMYACFPLCNPSRTCIWYGKDPRTTGIENNLQLFYQPNATLFAALKKAGYEIYGFGKLFHPTNLKTSIDAGEFDFYPGIYTGGWPVDYTKIVNTTLLPNEVPITYFKDDFIMNEMSWIDLFIEPILSNQLNRDTEKPFALFIGIQKPHAPFYVPVQYRQSTPIIPDANENITSVSELGKEMINQTHLNPGNNLYTPHSPYSRDMRLVYKTLVTYIDKVVERIMKALWGGPYKSNTHVIFTSDHGYALGEHEWFAKTAPWRNVVQVPYYYWHANNTETTTRLDHHSLIDVYPTILDLLNVPNITNLDGYSFKTIPSFLNSFAITRTNIGSGNFITNGLFWGKYHWIQYNKSGLLDYEIYYDDPEEVHNIVFEKPQLIQWLYKKYLNYTVSSS